MSSPAAWLADPTGRYQLRYWDGAAWTDYVSTNGTQGSDPVGAAVPPPPAAPAAPSGGSWMDKAKAKAQEAASAANRAMDSAAGAVQNQTDQWQQEYRASQSPTAGQGGGPVVPGGTTPPVVASPQPASSGVGQAPLPSGVGQAPLPSGVGQAPLPPGVGTPQPGAPAPAAAASAGAAAPAGAGQSDAAEQIRKLAALRDEGILTDDEFAAKKAQVLGI